MGRSNTAYPARVPEVIERWSRRVFLTIATFAIIAVVGLSVITRWGWLLWLLVVPFLVIGIVDMRQKSHAIQRNFPVIGRLRYFLESLRPEIRQYYVESDSEENPISREKRSIVYQRAKNQLDTLPFGTRRDVYANGYDWINHSLAAVEPANEEARIRIGGENTSQPYDASVLNISAMSYGSLSGNAILALNEGARRGGFYHNTGEGGLSPYHLERGGDIVWQIGTGYFGCRTPEGRFSEDAFAKNVSCDNVKMVEIKLSQGAKPGHGGILPASKVTPEIAAIRGVPLGADVLSPPVHSCFSTPVEMMQFIQKLRKLSAGKPVGFKLCVGERVEFMALCKAMLETGVLPDFITVDGAEGGTGAAPPEFSNSVGVPLREGLSFVHNALRGAGLREEIKIIAAGKITTGFHVVQKLALGADLCNSARGMMFALGCIQALKCNSNHCPVGVATQDSGLVRGLVVEDKALRVKRFHRATVESVYHLIAAAGLNDPTDVRPEHIYTRVGVRETRSYAELYPELASGSFLSGAAGPDWLGLWNRARPERFALLERRS